MPYSVKILLIILGWGTSLSALTLGMIFQGFLLPAIPISGGGLLPEVYNASPLGLWIYYLGSFGISIAGAMVISEVAPALVAFFSSFSITAVITFVVLALPDLLGVVPTQGVVSGSAVHFTFSALFPVALFVDLLGTIVGIALGERFLSLTAAFSNWTSG